MRYHKVSKLEDSELHYTKLLQLYLPQRNDEDLKRDCSTYAEKFKFVKNEKLKSTMLSMVNLIYSGPSDYGMLNPDLLNLDSDEQVDSSQPSTVPVTSIMKWKINHYHQQYFMKCVPC